MEIEKHGKFQNKIIRFRCSCGCVFKAVKGEFITYQSPPLGDVHEAKCPECGATVAKYKGEFL